MEETLSVVAHCPVCDAPIYGPRRWHPQRALQVKRTCFCYRYIRARAQALARAAELRAREYGEGEEWKDR